MTLPRISHPPLLGADQVPLHLLLIGGDNSSRRTFLSAALDLIDDHDEPAIVYDPTGHLAAQFYLESHGDVQLAPWPAAPDSHRYNRRIYYDPATPPLSACA